MFPVDRSHDLSLIGPEPSFETFLRQMFRQGRTPGTGSDDSYSVNSLHIVNPNEVVKKPASLCGFSDLPNLFG